MILVLLIAIILLSIYLLTITKKTGTTETSEATIGRLRKEINVAKTVATKNAITIQSQGEEIECLQAQMRQVHHWLGVLQVSDLIRSEYGVETVDVVRILRERVEWQKEIDKQAQDDSDFYEGDR